MLGIGVNEDVDVIHGTRNGYIEKITMDFIGSRSIEAETYKRQGREEEEDDWRVKAFRGVHGSHTDDSMLGEVKIAIARLLDFVSSCDETAFNCGDIIISRCNDEKVPAAY